MHMQTTVVKQSRLLFLSHESRRCWEGFQKNGEEIKEENWEALSKYTTYVMQLSNNKLKLFLRRTLCIQCIHCLWAYQSFPELKILECAFHPQDALGLEGKILREIIITRVVITHISSVGVYILYSHQVWTEPPITRLSFGGSRKGDIVQMIVNLGAD